MERANVARFKILGRGECLQRGNRAPEFRVDAAHGRAYTAKRLALEILALVLHQQRTRNNCHGQQRRNRAERQ